MKTQKHNQGELQELTVMIEKEIAEAVDLMAKNSGLSPADIVVIALKRFKASHTDYLRSTPRTE